MKLLCVLVGILATTMAKGTTDAKFTLEDKQTLSPATQQGPEVPVSKSIKKRGILKYWNQPHSRYYNPVIDYVPPLVSYVPPPINYLPPVTDYVLRHNNHVPRFPFVPTEPISETPRLFQQNQINWTPDTLTSATNHAGVIKNEHFADDNGNYRYEYQLTDGTHVGQDGFVLNPNTENQSLVKRGSYSFVGADGYTHLVTYWADHTGYHPTYRKFL